MTSHETAASIRLTELFIASDTDLDEKYGVKSNTALMLAAKDGRLASLRLLLAAGASVGGRVIGLLISRFSTSRNAIFQSCAT